MVLLTAVFAAEFKSYFHINMLKPKKLQIKVQHLVKTKRV